MNGIGSKARERALAEQANRQFGVLRWEDLAAAGLGARAIEGRLAVRRLTRVHHRVYALGHTALTAEGRWLAALWACGPGATLSHTSAAAYHGLEPEEPGGPVHVSTTRSIRSRPGIVVHRVRRLEPADVFVPRPFSVTRIPRTFVDLADVLTWPRYRALADDQWTLRLDRIREAQRRAPFRVGAPLVTRLIAADDAHTRSEFERRYLRFADAHGVPRPDALNVLVAGH